MRSEARTFEERIDAEREGALLLYHGVQRSIRVTVKAADERNAVHADTLIQLQLLFKEGRKVMAVSSSAGPS